MFQLIKEVKDYIKYKKCVIDNLTCRLHYQFTFTGLLVACLLSMANQLVGDKINCMVEHVPNDVMNSYCWIQGSFTIPSQHNEKNVIHSGVSAPTALENEYDDITIHNPDDKRYHAWYQWVSLILLLQALMFYIPHYFWKAAEGGKIAAIVKDLDGFTIAGSIEKKDDDESKKKEKHRKDIAEYLAKSGKSSGSHNLYAWFIAFEFMYLVNIILQAYLMDLFLGNEFTQYGTKVLEHYFQATEDRNDPMSKVFPRITKCTFKQYGTSGSNENWDAMCVLPINMINEKIYIVIWFWFIVLTIWTAVHMMIQILIFFVKPLRVKSLISKCRLLDQGAAKIVLDRAMRGNYGDYVLLRQMATSMEAIQFNEVINLVSAMENSGSREQEVGHNSEGLPV